ncbi:MAG: hypothetical protein HYY84_14475 [Deltaproteobacteria bacterium]|nr:hypothetical protein [Deltaproteobacteria bacterium]
MYPRAIFTVLLLAELVGCAPNTVTRRSAFVPTPAPPVFSGKPLPAGRAEISLAANPVVIGVVKDPSPKIGDAGLYAPNTQYEVALRYGFGGWIDLGVLFQWAPWFNKSPSAVGVPPLPNGGDLFGAGFSIRAGGKLAKGLRGGVAIEGASRSIAYAVWECQTCTNDYTYSSVTYNLKSTGREQFFDYAIAGALAWDFGVVSPFLSFAVASTIENVGFDPNVSTSSTLTHGEPMPILGAGAEIAVERLRFRGMFWIPVNRSPVNYFPLAFSAAVGLVL